MEGFRLFCGDRGHPVSCYGTGKPSLPLEYSRCLCNWCSTECYSRLYWYEGRNKGKRTHRTGGTYQSQQSIERIVYRRRRNGRGCCRPCRTWPGWIIHCIETDLCTACSHGRQRNAANYRNINGLLFRCRINCLICPCGRWYLY